MGKESQPEPIDARKLAFLPTKPLTHVAHQIEGEQTIVGITTLSLGSEEDPRHIASFLEAVGTPDTITTSKDPWENRRAKFNVYMLRYSLGNPHSEKGEFPLETTRVLLFSTKRKVQAYSALDYGISYVKEKRAENEGKENAVAESLDSYIDLPQEEI